MSGGRGPHSIFGEQQGVGHASSMAISTFLTATCEGMSSGWQVRPLTFEAI